MGVAGGIEALTSMAGLGLEAANRIKSFIDLANGNPYCVIGEYEFEGNDSITIYNEGTIVLRNPEQNSIKLSIAPDKLKDYRLRTETDAEGRPTQKGFVETGNSVNLYKNARYTLEKDYPKVKSNNVRIRRIPNSTRSLYFDITNNNIFKEGKIVTDKPILLRGEHITGKIVPLNPNDNRIKQALKKGGEGKTFELAEDLTEGVSDAATGRYIFDEDSYSDDPWYQEFIPRFKIIKPPMTFPAMSSKTKPAIIEIKNAKLYDSSIIGLGIENTINEVSGLVSGSAGGGSILEKLGLKSIMGEYFGYTIEDRIDLLRSFSKKRSILFFSYRKDNFDFVQLDEFTIERIPDEPNAVMVSLVLKTMNILIDFTQDTILQGFEKLKSSEGSSADVMFSGQDPETGEKVEGIDQGINDDSVVVRDKSLDKGKVADTDRRIIEIKDARDKLNADGKVVKIAPNVESGISDGGDSVATPPGGGAGRGGLGGSLSGGG